MFSVIFATIFDILKKNEDKELCKRLKKDIKKFENKDNIKYKNVLDDYNFLCNKQI